VSCEWVGQIVAWFSSISFSNWIEIIKIAGAAVAFGIGLWQYRKSQGWKRLEFVASETKAFYDDTAVKAAMSMLDSRKKKMALFKFRNENDLERVVVDYEVVASALGTDAEMQYDKRQSAIREIFERFLEFLARFDGFVEAGLVRKKDLNPYLDYWMKLIAGHDDHSREATEKVLPHLWKFIDYYGYRDVRRLVSRYHTVAFPEFKG
jgi:hypothetical protein